MLVFNRKLSMQMAVLAIAAMSALPTFAQDKMSGDKMSGGKMSGGKMEGDTMMAKATSGLTPGEKKFVMAKMNKMGDSDKMAMEKKLGAMSASKRRSTVSSMMKSDGKMSGNKMSGKM